MAFTLGMILEARERLKGVAQREMPCTPFL